MNNMIANTNSLTPAQRWLVQRMHQTRYGTIYNLQVRDGDPVVVPPPKIKQSFKLGGKRHPARLAPDDFALKQQHVELLELLERKQNGLIATLTIQDGLPFFVEWEDA